MFSRLAQFALVALALTISNHANAQALRYGNYYDETVSVNCIGAGSCRVNFSQLPADKLVMIQKINCTISSTQPVQQALLQISATNGGSSLSRFFPIALTPSQFVASNYFTNFREDPNFLVGQSRFPFVQAYASTTATWVFTCILIGELVTPL